MIKREVTITDILREQFEIGKEKQQVVIKYPRAAYFPHNWTTQVIPKAEYVMNLNVQYGER